MFYSSVLLAVTAMTGLVASQVTIDPNSVPLSERSNWCLAETNTCPEICGNDGTTANTCDPSTLDYTCTCRSGNTPNISEYTQTIPFYVCQTYIAQCIAANTNSAQAQDKCKATQCGNLTANSESAATTSSASSSSATPTASSASSASGSATASSTSGTASSASPTAAKSSAAMALAVGRAYGTPALVVGLLAAFGLAM
ncbi:hypothetical protein ANO11243_032140 [Dothideomycetidae sp. 11243]|nr:hypothetical protein ANO11243_032140 [fungal sp. No.11243]